MFASFFPPFSYLWICSDLGQTNSTCYILSWARHTINDSYKDTPDSSLLISYSSVSSKYHLSVRPSPFTNTPQPSSMLYCSPWHRSSSNILYILYICFLNCPSFPQQNYRPHERSSLLSLCTQGRRQAVPKHCPHFLRETGGSHHRVLVNLEIWERKTTEHSKSFSLNQIQWGHLPNPDSLKEATRAPEDITFWAVVFPENVYFEPGWIHRRLQQHRNRHKSQGPQQFPKTSHTSGQRHCAGS